MFIQHSNLDEIYKLKNVDYSIYYNVVIEKLSKTEITNICNMYNLEYIDNKNTINEVLDSNIFEEDIVENVEFYFNWYSFINYILNDDYTIKYKNKKYNIKTYFYKFVDYTTFLDCNEIKFYTDKHIQKFLIEKYNMKNLIKSIIHNYETRNQLNYKSLLDKIYKFKYKTINKKMKPEKFNVIKNNEFKTEFLKFIKEYNNNG